MNSTPSICPDITFSPYLYIHFFRAISILQHDYFSSMKVERTYFHFTRMDRTSQPSQQSQPPQPSGTANNVASDDIGLPSDSAVASASAGPSPPALPQFDSLDVDGATNIDVLLAAASDLDPFLPQDFDLATAPADTNPTVATEPTKPAPAPPQVPIINNTFPALPPSQILRFTNFDEEAIKEGYDSEGGQVYLADADIVDDADAFEEEAIVAPPPTQASLPPPSQAVVSEPVLTEDAVNKMKSAELKEALKKRGRAVSGNKEALKERLLEAIRNNAPVLQKAVARHESMNGLDVTAEWVLLTKNPIPVPEPINDDCELRPPTERDAPINPKYEFTEVFTRIPFSGTTKNMGYITKKRSPRKSKNKLTPARQLHDAPPEPRTCGGPSESFLKRYNLDEKSHPIEWFTALCPLTPREHRFQISSIQLVSRIQL